MNDLTISTLQTLLPETETLKKAAVDETTSPFTDYVKHALADVNRQMVDADQDVKDLATGKNQDIHQTMISLKKAEISFELVMQIRNKIVSAYDEIRRMSI